MRKMAEERAAYRAGLISKDESARPIKNLESQGAEGAIDYASPGLVGGGLLGV
ncbi:MAG: hypothetical protein MUP14_00360 [Dehalococcoidia bacterium]|nr:hypothetical protein [Dehalococcoidia bacterium]